ncbi:MAG: lipocalin-like domain-containing protein [Bacteroidaceae bacterium]|nr:lipocalin-like domain-containing protein [Bacteroidaceae bacterium]
MSRKSHTLSSACSSADKAIYSSLTTVESCRDSAKPKQASFCSRCSKICFIFHFSLKRSIPLLLLLLLTASCEKNMRYSALDGFWQVTSVEDKATGTATNPGGRLYISFDCELAKLSYLTDDHNTGFLGFEYIGSFTQQGDSLRFSTFYVYHYTNPQETTPAPADHLRAFGIHAQPVSFALRMTRSDMTLDNAETRLTLRKY